ncbi:MAG: hypothetical protein QXG01_02760, partial [Candidatus Bathyarchaeia archaeon]
LMLSASAASSCFNVLKPNFKKAKTQFLARVIIGTVEGDIHDIGKNIPILYGANYIIYGPIEYAPWGFSSLLNDGRDSCLWE